MGEITKLIKEMKSSHSFGNEGIDSESLKVAPEAIAAPITHLINLSIENRKFPSKWKLGRVIPLHKGGGKSHLVPESFRPISLLPSVSKLAEKVVQLQISRHMDNFHLWHGNLHSYRKNHSTASALAQVSDTTFQASDEKEIAAVIAVDESAAFDSLSHQILLNKLQLYGMHSNTIEWIEDYLSARSQYVTIGAQDSSIKSLSTGIPQGSILGPTLFNVYINDFPEIINEHGTCQSEEHNGEDLFNSNCKLCGNLSVYADDAVFTAVSKNRNENQRKLSRMLLLMKEYLNNNAMTMNPTKTILWEFLLKQKACKLRGNPPSLTTYNHQGDIKVVRASKSEKCLGGIMQQDLQWRALIETGTDALLPSLRKKLGILKHLAKNIPRPGRHLLANGLILGRINYLLPIYGGTQAKYLNKIQVVMNNSVRFVTGAGRRVSTVDLMTAVNWLTIREMIKMHTLTMTWKVVHLRTPRHLADKITRNPDNTLSTSIPRLLNTSLGLRWRMVDLWNHTPIELRDTRSLSIYKRKLKKWIISQRGAPSQPQSLPAAPPAPGPPAAPAGLPGQPNPPSSPPGPPLSPHRRTHSPSPPRFSPGSTPSPRRRTLSPHRSTLSPHRNLPGQPSLQPSPHRSLPGQPSPPRCPPGPTLSPHRSSLSPGPPRCPTGSTLSPHRSTLSPHSSLPGQPSPPRNPPGPPLKPYRSAPSPLHSPQRSTLSSPLSPHRRSPPRTSLGPSPGPSPGPATSAPSCTIPGPPPGPPR